MKLSQLKALVLALEAHAERNGNADPKVEFYDDDRPKFAAAFQAAGPFFNMEVAPDVDVKNVHKYAVLSTGEIATRGDFAIPLVPV